MSRPKAFYAVLVILALVVASFGIYRQVDARRGDAAAAAAPSTVRTLVPAPLTVSLSALSDRRVAAVGVSTFLAVNAAGPKISEVRVYDGDALVGVRRFEPAATNRVSVQVEWPAVRRGTHLLHAEATGADPGQVGHSAPLRLQAVPGVVPARTVAVPGNGRTPRELAAATGAGLGDLRFTGSNGRPVRPNPDRPLAPGVRAEVRLANITQAPPATPPATSAGRSSAATSITAVLDSCRASVTPAEGSVAVYELTGGAAGFTLRGQAGADKPYRSTELTPGTHVFVAGPVGEPADSAPVALEVPASCMADAWSGKATLFDGELRLPKPEPQVWVYLGVDGKPFQRVPAQGSVSASFGQADLAQLMPTLAGSKVRMEVWRPGATPSAAATLVARSESSLADPDALTDLLGSAPSIELRGPQSANPVTMKATNTSVSFDWSTQSQVPDGVIWQVLGRPLSSADQNTAPPVMLATGFSKDGDGTGVLIGAAKGGTFEIPAKLLLGGRQAAGPITSLLQQVPTPSIAALVKPGSSFGATPLKAPAGGTIPTLDAGIVPIPIGDVYVRVLPVSGEAVVGQASNTVAVELPPLGGDAAGFEATKVTFDPGVAANSELFRCVRVTGTPTGLKNFISVYSQDKTYCAGDFAGKGGGCQGWCQITKDVGSLVSFVGKVWDYIATAYNTVVDTVVTLIAKFNPYCLTASAASAISKSPYAQVAADGCEKIATVVASVVVSVVLSSFGLPARLPTSDQLSDIVEGDLTGLAVAYLEQLGVPCSQMTADPATVAAVDQSGVEVPSGIKSKDGSVDVCAAMIGQAVEAIRGQVKARADAEVANTSGLPIPPAPQQMIIEPRSQYEGATIVVEAEPIDPNTPKTARCSVKAVGEVPDIKVGLYGVTEIHDIGNGYGRVGYRPQSVLGFGAPWGARIALPPITDLIDSDTITVSVDSQCFAPVHLKSFPATHPRPALGRWYAGQAD